MRFTALAQLYERQETDAKTALGRQERRRADLLAERGTIADGVQAAGIGVPLALHEQYLAFWKSEQVRLARLDQAIAEQDKAVALARAALADAHRRRITIGKLRERDAAVARQRTERREQRHADDRAAAAWTRR